MSSHMGDPRHTGAKLTDQIPRTEGAKPVEREPVDFYPTAHAIVSTPPAAAMHMAGGGRLARSSAVSCSIYLEEHRITKNSY